MNRRTFKKKARMEIIPLLDVIFLVLTFFLYAVLQMTVEKGILIDLPEVSANETSPQKDENFIVVGITAKGETYFNKDKVTLDKLHERILLEKRKNDKLVICLRGDKNAYHSQTVAVLNILIKAGATRIFFEVSAG